MNKHTDVVVIGGGFKGMMTAYGLRKKGLDVVIVEKGKLLGGFMAPIRWRELEVDKGPQYLDGINDSQKAILDEIMDGYEPLSSLDFSYSSFWNGVLTSGFAIPDYRSLPLQERAQILYETIANSGCSNNPNTISDMYFEVEPQTWKHIDRWCKKFLLSPAIELSPLNTRFSTFFGRKLLLDNETSIQLKLSPFLDGLLAAQKNSLEHGTYNLYPKGRSLGYFRSAFEQKLIENGVAVELESEVLEVSYSDKHLELKLDKNRAITAKRLYCAGPVESTEMLLLGDDTLKHFIYPVSQVFYLLEMAYESNLPFYVMNYDDVSVARITNFSKYAGKGEGGRSVICVEVPAATGSKIWNNTESHYPVVVNELAAMGVNVENVISHEAFRIPSTYRALRPEFGKAYEFFCERVTEKFGDLVHLLPPHLLTRASIMSDLQSRNIV